MTNTLKVPASVVFTQTLSHAFNVVYELIFQFVNSFINDLSYRTPNTPCRSSFAKHQAKREAALNTFIIDLLIDLLIHLSILSSMYHLSIAGCWAYHVPLHSSSIKRRGQWPLSVRGSIPRALQTHCGHHVWCTTRFGWTKAAFAGRRQALGELEMRSGRSVKY